MPCNDKELSLNSQNLCKSWTPQEWSYGEMVYRDRRILQNSRAMEPDLFSLPASHSETRQTPSPSTYQRIPKAGHSRQNFGDSYGRRELEHGITGSLQSPVLLPQLCILTWCRDRAFCCLFSTRPPSSVLWRHVLVNSAKSCRLLWLLHT